MVSSGYSQAPILGATVAFAVSGGAGSITGPATNTTNPRGVAILIGSWTLGLGANQLTATVGSTGTAGPPLTITINATGTP